MRRTIGARIGLFVLPVIAASGCAHMHAAYDGAQSACFSPDGRHLLFAYRQGDEQHLLRANVDDLECEQLTHGDRFDVSPVYSPDGQAVVFSSRLTDDEFPLYELRFAGREIAQLTTGHKDWMPAFSPDGTHIVFVRSAGRRNTDLHVVQRNGVGLRQLTSGDDADVLPRFLDNRTIVFGRDWYDSSTVSPQGLTLHSAEVFLLQLDTGLIAKLSDSRYGDAVNTISVCPATRQIAYSFSDSYTDTCWISSLDTDKATLVPFHPIGDAYYKLQDSRRTARRFMYPSFSEDGRCILFTLPIGETPGSPSEIHIADVGSMEARQLTRLGLFAFAPRLSPNGSTISFFTLTNRRHADLWIIPASGGDARRIDPGRVVD